MKKVEFKAEYVQPKTEVIVVEYQVGLLADSINELGNDDEPCDDFVPCDDFD